MAKKIAFSLFWSLIGLWIVSPIILPIELKANLYNHEARIDVYNQGNLENSVVVQRLLPRMAAKNILDSGRRFRSQFKFENGIFAPNRKFSD